MATRNLEGKTRGSRLQVFLSSLFASIGEVLGQDVEQEEEPEMASRAVVPQQGNNGLFCFFWLLILSGFGSLCSFPLNFEIFALILGFLVGFSFI